MRPLKASLLTPWWLVRVRVPRRTMRVDRLAFASLRLGAVPGQT
jgi:hypothetical protein